ncbi:MAG TPA: glycine--tRNA ligase subunit beta [Steroidobacteraceae bacterium]|jgi:glycyl-tRNA synthetase beta chain|nr:glycine--tRNA ligase subunit beta [Steroidobacteraceae bacterium]
MNTARIERRDLLVELGTEELPPKALSAMSQAFAEALRSGLAASNIVLGSVESFATPRRLAVLVRRVAAQQPDQLVHRRGPPVSVAFDAAGAPTRAASAFAASCAVGIEALGRERDARGVEYLSYEGTRAGQSTRELLPGLVRTALDALPIPKRMRWGTLSEQFARPVHWLVLLFGREVVPATLLGVSAGNSTRGHRFMAPQPLRLASPGVYAQTLLTRGRVVAHFESRRDQIHAQITALAEQLGGRAIIDPALLDEVTALVEWPVALAGQFEARFLSLPREVLLATLQAHQRYFAIQGGGGTLLPRFITIANIDSPQPELVRAGNERVVRPRLADAAFFWEQDRRAPLAARRAGLDAVTFQAQLGSLGARTERIAALAHSIAVRIGADAAHTARAAQLAKCDLLSAMVGEFPELQGTMGRYYAHADAESAPVAEAIAEHYLPRGAGDALPASRVGDAVALADKLDLLAGIFAIDQRPSGTRDPFGLRRAAIGALRILLEHRLELDLPALLEQAVRAQPLATLEPARSAALARELYDYMMERLRAQYLEMREHSGISTEMFEAVLACRPGSVLDFDARLRALVAFTLRPEGASLAAANKRIANILRKSAAPLAHGSGSTGIDPSLLREPAERSLAEALQSLAEEVQAATQRRDYAAALDRLAALRPAVDAFFDQVLVNDPDAALRANRLALLGALRALFSGIADFSCLPG